MGVASGLGHSSLSQQYGGLSSKRPVTTTPVWKCEKRNLPLVEELPLFLVADSGISKEVSDSHSYLVRTHVCSRVLANKAASLENTAAYKKHQRHLQRSSADPSFKPPCCHPLIEVSVGVKASPQISRFRADILSCENLPLPPPPPPQPSGIRASFTKAAKTLGPLTDRHASLMERRHPDSLLKLYCLFKMSLNQFTVSFKDF